MSLPLAKVDYIEQSNLSIAPSDTRYSPAQAMFSTVGKFLAAQGMPSK